MQKLIFSIILLVLVPAFARADVVDQNLGCTIITQPNIASGDNEGLGQTFTAISGFTVTDVIYQARKQNNPTGNAYAKLYELTGTYGTDAKPSGSAFATSDAKPASTFDSALASTTFTFSGLNQAELTAGTNYIVTIEFTGGDASNYLEIAWCGNVFDGNISYTSDLASWTGDNTWDAIYQLNGDPVAGEETGTATTSTTTAGTLLDSEQLFIWGVIIFILALPMWARLFRF